jgi:hypothetical protein
MHGMPKHGKVLCMEVGSDASTYPTFQGGLRQVDINQHAYAWQAATPAFQGSAGLVNELHRPAMRGMPMPGKACRTWQANVAH